MILNEDLRPSFGEGAVVKPALRTLLERGWDKDPDNRPDIREIQSVIQSAYAQSQGNLIDQMIQMNSKYANNLENIVASREAILRETRENTNKLLNEMLPAAIADQLKIKKEIIPRNYDSATVLFCQLVDFGLLIEKTSPEYIISYLNDVFNRFDEIIKAHDAYKVETTGETYMVASGVPSENDGRHIFEIADIALELREKTYSYKVILKDSVDDYKVRVRIGFHCGPIAAGVIGIKSPRYCLFGDTVNFASRMQSNCPPNQIQTSEVTALQLMKNPDYQLVQRGIVKVKGKGDVNCYWLNEHIHGEHGIVTEQIVVGGGRPPTANTALTRRILTTATGRLSQMGNGRQAGAEGASTTDILLIEPPPPRLMTANRPRSRRASKIEEEAVVEEAAEIIIEPPKRTKKTRFIDEKKSQ
ncbi:hypothetical protein PMAYCL1PPCAC_00131 [Pristionchus mayeri]|uniref:Guanylate cyclase domain-containing protein n=1 Tax=Pristionchus mayeri TaxID=1317129 RepID=A0AAN4YZX7_9BILA|nr:hypothetical protein PMAYCL1PPCAC_00131 [Pristionchus mayeri]